MSLIIVLTLFAAFLLTLVAWMAEASRRRIFNARAVALDVASARYAQGSYSTAAVTEAAQAFANFLTR